MDKPKNEHEPQVDAKAVIAALKYTGMNMVRNDRFELVSRTMIIKWVEAHAADIDNWLTTGAP